MTERQYREQRARDEDTLRRQTPALDPADRNDLVNAFLHLRNTEHALRRLRELLEDSARRGSISRELGLSRLIACDGSADNNVWMHLVLLADTLARIDGRGTLR